MEIAKKVLHSYSVYPLHVEVVTDRVYRVSDGNRDYALKRSKLSNENLPIWETVYQQAYSQNLSTILPVYLTNEGNMYKELNNSIFYLTPWVDTADSHISKQAIEQLYRCIGSIHAKTKQTQTIPVTDFVTSFNTYKKYCEDIEGKMLEFVEQFEKNRYMSPFELLVCTHYRDLDYSLREINKRIEQLVNEQEERDSWNYSLCHRNLRFSHTLNNRQNHFINWEHARYDNAVFDLATLFKNETITHDAPVELFMELFSTYYNENKLTNKELCLLTIHLLNPIPYMTIVQQYSKKPLMDTMINQVKNLQHAYRQLLFGLQWSNYVENEYETVTLDDLES